MIIAVDFDGTCVTHDYPKVGKDVGAVEVLRDIVSKGHNIMLWTMRDKKELTDAVQWFDNNNITLYGINENPTQRTWSNSNKQYAHIYIDDTALGCPLKYDPAKSEHPFVDWNIVREYLEKMKVL